MAVSLDADVGQIFRNLMRKKSGGTDKSGKVVTDSLSKSYYKQAIVKSVLIVCVTAGIAFGISTLTQSASDRTPSDFTSNQDMADAVAKIEQDIATSKALLVKNRKNVEEILPMFSDIEGSKALFKLISNLAAQNNLIINVISQGETTETISPAKYVQTKILLNIEGYFANYLTFINALNKEKPILRVESENSKLIVTKEGERKLQITLNIIDYSVQKDEYEKILSSK